MATIDTTIVYDTQASMVAAEKLVADTLCKTLGYAAVADGGGGEFLWDTDAADTQMVSAAVINNAGTGYRVGNWCTVSGGTGTSCVVEVLTVTGGGATGPVGTIRIINPGKYSVNPTTTGVATTVDPAGGDNNLTLDLTMASYDNSGKVIANAAVGAGRYLRLVGKGYVNTAWFGAKGDDSNHEETAIQKALDTAWGDGVSKVVTNSGNFKIYGEIYIPPYVSWEGEGYYTLIKPQSSLAVAISTNSVYTGANLRTYAALKNMRIGGQVANGGTVLQWAGANRSTLRDLIIETTGPKYFIDCYDSWGLHMDNVKVYWPGAGVSNNTDGAALHLGDNMNAVLINGFYTGGYGYSTAPYYGILIDDLPTPSSSPQDANGITIIGPRMHIHAVGIYVKNAGLGGVNINGIYTEKIANPIIVGDPTSSYAVRGFSLIGGVLGGPEVGDPHTSTGCVQVLHCTSGHFASLRFAKEFIDNSKPLVILNKVRRTSFHNCFVKNTVASASDYDDFSQYFQIADGAPVYTGASLYNCGGFASDVDDGLHYQRVGN